MEMVFDHLVITLHPISNQQCTSNVKYEAVVPLFSGDAFSVSCRTTLKEQRPVNVVCPKAIMWIISDTYIFFQSD